MRLRGDALDVARAIPVVEHHGAVAPTWVWRTWCERWFSRPWDPFLWRKLSNEPAAFLIRSPDAELASPVPRTMLPITRLPYILAHPDAAERFRREIKVGVPSWGDA